MIALLKLSAKNHKCWKNPDSHGKLKCKIILHKTYLNKNQNKKNGNQNYTKFNIELKDTFLGACLVIIEIKKRYCIVKNIRK